MATVDDGVSGHTDKQAPILFSANQSRDSSTSDPPSHSVGASRSTSDGFARHGQVASSRPPFCEHRVNGEASVSTVAMDVAPELGFGVSGFPKKVNPVLGIWPKMQCGFGVRSKRNVVLEFVLGQKVHRKSTESDYR